MAILNSPQKERVYSDSEKISWMGPVAGCSFYVSEACKVLNPRANPLFPGKGIWIPCVPTKATFFAWEATWGKVFNSGQTTKKGVATPQPPLSLWPRRGIHPSYLAALSDGQPPLGPLFFLNWLLLGLSKICQGCSHKLEGLLFWKKDLEIRSTLYLLDYLERAQSHNF